MVGLILSIIALTQIKKTGEKGKGFAIAGIIISILWGVIVLLIVASMMIFTAGMFSALPLE